MALIKFICSITFTCIIINVFQPTSADDVDKRLEKLENVITEQHISIELLQQRVSEIENENRRLKAEKVSQESKVELNEMRITQLEKELENARLDHCATNMDSKQKGDDETEPMNQDQKTTSYGYLRRSFRGSGQVANVAFHASMSNTICFHRHEPYIFDVEEIDEGNGYSIHDGIYVVPVTGVYVFTFTIASGSGYYIRPQIVVNGSVKGSTISDSDDSSDIHPATVIVLVSVMARDHVFVRTEDSNTCYVMSNIIYGKSTFSGWLLF